MRKKVLCMILALLLILGSPIQALAGLLENSPERNQKILSELQGITGSKEEAKKYYGLLQKYNLLDEKGNPVEKWAIRMDGRDITLSELREILKGEYDPNRYITVDNTPITLRDVATMVQIEDHISYLREKYFNGQEWTEEQKENLESLKNQIETRGITIREGEQTPLVNAKGISHSARVSIKEPEINGEEAKFEVVLTGARENQPVSFHYWAASGTQPALGEGTFSWNWNTTGKQYITLRVPKAHPWDEKDGEGNITVPGIRSNYDLVFYLNADHIENALFEGEKRATSVRGTTDSTIEVTGQLGEPSDEMPAIGAGNQYEGDKLTAKSIVNGEPVYRRSTGEGHTYTLPKCVADPIKYGIATCLRVEPEAWYGPEVQLAYPGKVVRDIDRDMYLQRYRKGYGYERKGYVGHLFYEDQGILGIYSFYCHLALYKKDASLTMGEKTYQGGSYRGKWNGVKKLDHQPTLVSDVASLEEEPGKDIPIDLTHIDPKKDIEITTYGMISDPTYISISDKALKKNVIIEETNPDTAEDYMWEGGEKVDDDELDWDDWHADMAYPAHVLLFLTKPPEVCTLEKKAPPFAETGTYYPGQVVPVVIRWNQTIRHYGDRKAEFNPDEEGHGTIANLSITGGKSVFYEKEKKIGSKESIPNTVNTYSNAGVFPYSVQEADGTAVDLKSLDLGDLGPTTFRNELGLGDEGGGYRIQGNREVDGKKEVKIDLFKESALGKVQGKLAGDSYSPEIEVSLPISSNEKLSAMIANTIDPKTRKTRTEKSEENGTLYVSVDGGETRYPLEVPGESITGSTLKGSVPIKRNLTEEDKSYVLEVYLNDKLVLGNAVQVDQKASKIIKSGNLGEILLTKDGKPYAFESSQEPLIYVQGKDTPKITTKIHLDREDYTYGDVSKVAFLNRDPKDERTAKDLVAASEDPKVKGADFVFVSSNLNVAAFNESGELVPTGSNGKVTVTLVARNGGDPSLFYVVDAFYKIAGEKTGTVMNFEAGLIPFVTLPDMEVIDGKETNLLLTSISSIKMTKILRKWTWQSPVEEPGSRYLPTRSPGGKMNRRPSGFRRGN